MIGRTNAEGFPLLPDDSITITAYDGDGRISSVDFHGSVIKPGNFSFTSLAGDWAMRRLTSIAFLDPITSIGIYGLTCVNIASISFPLVTVYPTKCFQANPLLISAQLGSIGYPVTSIQFQVFALDLSAELIITVYVTPGTQPLASSPWGATNASIIYRSAVTGEVL